MIAGRIGSALRQECWDPPTMVRMNTNDQTVSAQWWLKLTLVPFVLALVALAGWIAVNALFLRGDFRILDKVWNLLLACAVCWLAGHGLRLVRFFRHTLMPEGDGVRVVSPNSSEFYPWSDIRVRLRPRLQTIEVWSKTGRLVFATDWVARNAASFRERVVNRQAHRG